MACGKPSEYIGFHNKPEFCSCGHCFSTVASHEEAPKKTGPTILGNKIVVGDMKLSKTFLLNLINIEFEEDAK